MAARSDREPICPSDRCRGWSLPSYRWLDRCHTLATSLRGLLIVLMLQGMMMPVAFSTSCYKNILWSMYKYQFFIYYFLVVVRSCVKRSGFQWFVEPMMPTAVASVKGGLGPQRVRLHQGDQRCLFSQSSAWCAPPSLICLLLELNSTSSYLRAQWGRPSESTTSAARRSRLKSGIANWDFLIHFLINYSNNYSYSWITGWFVIHIRNNAWNYYSKLFIYSWPILVWIYSLSELRHAACHLTIDRLRSSWHFSILRFLGFLVAMVLGFLGSWYLKIYHSCFANTGIEKDSFFAWRWLLPGSALVN